MNLERTTGDGKFGVYKLTPGEQSLFGDLRKFTPRLLENSLERESFVSTLLRLFSSMPVQRKCDCYETSSRHPIIVDTAEIYGSIPEAGNWKLGVAVKLPNPFKTGKRNEFRSSLFTGNFDAGTLILGERFRSDSYVIAAMDISRSFGVVGQHEFGFRCLFYNHGMIDDIVDKIGLEIPVPIRSPISHNMGGETKPAMLIPTFGDWDKFLGLYERAEELLKAGSYSQDDLDVLRRDSRSHENLFIRGESKNLYLRILNELINK